MRRPAAWLVVVVALATTPERLSGQVSRQAGFDHPEHARLFPTCATCHAGAERPGAAMWPDPASCAECHDGTIEPRVRWQPRAHAAPSNLRFDHARHAAAVTGARGARVSRETTCTSCHADRGAPWMQVTRTLVGQCLDCHQAPREHLALADTSCATCHVPLVEARALPVARVEAFGVPPSHREPGFALSGHGQLARPPRGAPAGAGVAASCATCHARNFCITCHVDAPETVPIRALGEDERSLVHRARLEAPPSHQVADFERNHGQGLGRSAERCATCHTRESCLTCHVGAPPKAATALAAAGPGRGAGAATSREPPPSHTPDFAERHANVATAASRSCATCHVQAECRECHRPDPAAASFHPKGFLASHPTEAYTRETSCADCHNQAQFCQSCHAQSGLTARQALGAGGRYHDAKRFFLLGHGQAARQNLESCVSCHVEKDCLTCHAANVGRRFSPHGPGFDPNRLRRKNPELCRTCHSLNIPPG